MGIQVEPPGPADPITPQASVPVFNSVTSVTAGETLATTATLPAGVYSVAVQLNFEGAAASIDAANIQLLVGAGVITRYPNSDASEGLQTFVPVNVIIPAGGSTISLQAVALGTVGVIYVVLLVATKVG